MEANVKTADLQSNTRRRNRWFDNSFRAYVLVSTPDKPGSSWEESPIFIDEDRGIYVSHKNDSGARHIVSGIQIQMKDTMEMLYCSSITRSIADGEELIVTMDNCLSILLRKISDLLRQLED